MTRASRGTTSGSSHRPFLIVGWREKIKLPDLDVGAIKAKVDTGARTSALHAADIKFSRRGNKRFVRFTVHPKQRSTKGAISARAEVIDERMVRNSGGKQELRPVIQTTVEILGQQWLIELTLTSRDMMGFRMLLGREALRGRALVDPGHSFCT